MCSYAYETSCWLIDKEELYFFVTLEYGIFMFSSLVKCKLKCLNVPFGSNFSYLIVEDAMSSSSNASLKTNKNANEFFGINLTLVSKSTWIWD